MICFRCGSDVLEGSERCHNCGQVLQGHRELKQTVTSFRALELRRLRGSQREDVRPYDVGDLIADRYAIVDYAGHGPLAHVYRSHDRATGLDMAVNVVHPELVELGGAADQLITTLAQFAERPVDGLLTYDVMKDSEKLVCLTRFIGGFSLRKLIDLRRKRDKKFRLGEVEPRVMQILSILKAAHHLGVHGALKPANIMLQPDRIHLTEFGFFDAFPRSLFVDAQTTVGTHLHIAPEIRNGEAADVRADVYSLGTVIYELLSGLPYEPDAPKLKEILGVDETRDWTSLQDFVECAVCEERTGRFHDVSAMEEAFTACVADFTASTAAEMPGFNIQDTAAIALAGLPVHDRESAKSQDTAKLDIFSQIESPDTRPVPDELQGEVGLVEELAADDFVEVESSIQPHPGSSEDLTGVEEGRVEGDDDEAILIDPAELLVDLEPTHPRAVRQRDSRGRVASDTRKGRTPTKVIAVKKADTGFWLLKSDLGLALSVALVIVIVAFGVKQLLDRQRPETDNQGTEVVVVNAVDKPSEQSGKTSVVVEKAPSEPTQATPTKQPADPQQAAMVEPSASAAAALPGSVTEMKGEQGLAPSSPLVQPAEPARPNAADLAQSREASEALTEKPEPPVSPSNPRTAQANKALDSARPAAVAAPAEEPKAQEPIDTITPAAVAAVAAEPRKQKPIDAKADAEPKDTTARSSSTKVPVKKLARSQTSEAPATPIAAKTATKPSPRPEPRLKEIKQPDRAKAARNQIQDTMERFSAGRRKSGANSSDETIASDTLQCPRGMRLITTAKFPRRSVRNGKIKGGEAITLAQSGKAYCIDAYEYPGRNRKPQSGVTMATAQGLCSKEGKRLCTDREWVRACKGKGGADFPYGPDFRANACNTADDDGDERDLATSGRFRKCRSRYAVYDMSGNVAEWTSSQTVRGGDYTSEEDDAECGSGGKRSASTSRATIGFRCCDDFTE